MTRQITHSRPSVTAVDRAAVAATLDSGMVAAGDVARRFESAVGERLGMAAGVAAASGTDALVAALIAVGVKAGDQVIMPTYVCDAVWVAIHAAGGVPVLCDVAADRCVSAETVRPHLTPRTAAVIAVHTFGAVCDVTAINALGVPVIEDCCHSLGAIRDHQVCGTVGAACVLSFHGTKLLTTGEGGMALSARPDVATRLARMRRDAPPGEPHRVTPMGDLQAALGLSQLSQYDAFLDRRRQLAAKYFAALNDVNVALPVDERGRSVHFRFAVRSRLPFDAVQRAFAADGVHVRRGVDSLVHRRFAVAGSFPMSEQLFDETVSLPIYPSLSDADADAVIATARRVFGVRS